MRTSSATCHNRIRRASPNPHVDPKRKFTRQRSQHGRCHSGGFEVFGISRPVVGDTWGPAIGRVPWGGVGAVGKWPVAATATSLAAAGHLPTAVVIADLR